MVTPPARVAFVEGNDRCRVERPTAARCPVETPSKTAAAMRPTGGDEGIQVTNRLHEESLGTGVVVLSQYAEPG
jgi:hypothetical protein